MFGGQKINLRPVDGGDVGSWPTGVSADPGATDVCFITAVPPNEVIGHLHDNGVQILQFAPGQQSVDTVGRDLLGGVLP